MTKYNGVVLLAGLGVAVLAVGEFRVILRRPGFYLAIALTLALIAPHVVAAVSRGEAVSYGLARFDADGWRDRLASLAQLVLGDIGLLMPGLVIVAVGAWRGLFGLSRDPVSPEQRLLLIMNATMQVILLGLVLVGGLDYVFRYSAPYVMMAVLGLAPPLRLTAGWRIRAERELVFTLGGLYLALGLGIAVVYSLFASHSPMQEPTAAGARDPRRMGPQLSVRPGLFHRRSPGGLRHRPGGRRARRRAVLPRHCRRPVVRPRSPGGRRRRRDRHRSRLRKANDLLPSRRGDGPGARGHRAAALDPGREVVHLSLSLRRAAGLRPARRPEARWWPALTGGRPPSLTAMFSMLEQIHA